MAQAGRSDKVVVLRAPFKLGDRFVLFGRARLLMDRIVLKGFGYSRTIMLSQISEVRWIADELTIGLENGDEILLILPGAALWKYELQARCGLKDSSSAMSVQSLNALPRSADLNLDRNEPHVAASPEQSSHQPIEPKPIEPSSAQNAESRETPGYRISSSYSPGKQLDLGDAPRGDGADPT